MKTKQKPFQTNYINNLRRILTNSKHGLGSYKSLSELLLNYPQYKDTLRYIIAGSWAIEFLTGHRLKHRDIDIIILQNPLWYLDNAITQEEKCDGVIPLNVSYFENRNIVSCKSLRDKSLVYVPDINLQLCFKFIGELNSTLSKRAILQFSLLYEYAIKKGLNKDNVLLILKCCTPESINHMEITEQIISALNIYQKDKITWLKGIRSIHKTINKALHSAFNDVSIC